MGFINKFKVKKSGGTETVYDIVALSAQTSSSAFTSNNADNAEAIGSVERYSVYDGKQHEGLKFINGENTAVIELNSNGNLAVESLSKHLNLESSKGIQMKPTTNIIWDSSRRIANAKGNEVQIEAKFDDFGEPEYNSYGGHDEPWAELKINSRNIDLRCHDHGGIALQIAGTDGSGHENKVKFESDRITQIGATPSYSQSGEGGKGLEFGTFNNEHTSLYTGDYRFKGDANVYGVTRGTPTQTSTGKIDYPTQTDDFKDILDNTKVATWNDIIDAGKKCRNLDERINNAVAEAAMSASGIDVSGFVTKDNVEEIVASAISEMHIDTTGLATEQWVLDKHYIDELPDGLQYVSVGSKKGNFQIDVTGKYTWELTSPKSATTVDEFGTPHEKGDRIINYSNEAFYTDVNKVYYKAGDVTTLADGVTTVSAGTIVYASACNLTFNIAPEGTKDYYLAVMMGDGETSFYEDPTKFYYKAKSATKYFDGTDAPKKSIVQGAGLSQAEIDYYDSMGEILDEDGNVVQAAIWEKTDIWKKSTLWSKNEININLETDSKIKLAGAKIETVKTVDDIDYKMDEISLSTADLVVDATNVSFEQKISKNGDREGQDTEFVYSFTNNVADTTKVADFEAFKANYNEKHTPKTDEELQAMYDAFLAEGESYELRVKASELLSLPEMVNQLDEKVNNIETDLSGLTDTTITSPTDGQVLKYDQTTGKWINGNDNGELFVGTMTNGIGENGEYWSCDKTWAEIYNAYQAGKRVVIKSGPLFCYPVNLGSAGGTFSSTNFMKFGAPINQEALSSRSFSYQPPSSDINSGWTYSQTSGELLTSNEKQKLSKLQEPLEVKCFLGVNSISNMVAQSQSASANAFTIFSACPIDTPVATIEQALNNHRDVRVYYYTQSGDTNPQAILRPTGRGNNFSSEVILTTQDYGTIHNNSNKPRFERFHMAIAGSAQTCMIIYEVIRTPEVQWLPGIWD